MRAKSEKKKEIEKEKVEKGTGREIALEESRIRRWRAVSRESKSEKEKKN